jgi:2-methylisocitrate lyase-like PEP mutase family enzyme
VTGQARKHDLVLDAARLRALHVPGTPLLLANIWDPATARIVQSAGMRAIATASAALAPANGYEDHGKLPPDVAFSALQRIADAVTLPVTADIEDGYGLAAEELVERIANAGASGLNLEDTDHTAEALVAADQQAQRIAAIRRIARLRGFDVVINARTDVYIHTRPHEEGLQRARMYFEAGADCVYPILLSDASVIRDYATLGPTNVLWRPGGPTLRELAAAGVSRISLGPLLFQMMLKRLAIATHALRKLEDEGLRT